MNGKCQELLLTPTNQLLEYHVKGIIVADSLKQANDIVIISR